MPRILFIANVDWFFISHRLPLAIEARRKGFETHVACTITQDTRVFKDNGIAIHDLKMRRSGTSVFYELMAILRINRIIDTVKPGIVHLISIKPTIYGGLVCRLKNINSVVISISGLGYVYIGEELRTKILRILTSMLYRFAIKKGAYRVIFQNLEDLRVFSDMKAVRRKDTILVKGSGVSLDEYKPSPEPLGVPVVMLVSRLLVDKGVREFVEAARILHARGRQVRMVLVGGCDPGNPKTLSEKEIEAWASKGWIEYWGYQESVSSIMKQANIIALPSYREGMPKSLLEAAASARAVITTDVPGCRDAIIPQKTGLLVPTKDPISLADAIEVLCDDPVRRHEMAQAGRRLAEDSFNIHTVVRKHFELYDELMRRDDGFASSI